MTQNRKCARLGTITSADEKHHRFNWWDAQGIKHTKRVCGSLADVDVARARIILGANCDEDKPPLTFSQYWQIITPTLGGLADLTRCEYIRLWDVELDSRIGGVQLDSLTWRDAEKALNDIPSPGTAIAASRLLKKVCNLAIRDGLMTANPVDRLNLRPVPKKEKRILASSGVSSWLESIKGIKYEPWLLVMLGAGLRVEEAAALRWEDVEPFENNGKAYIKLHVDKAIVVVPSVGKVIKPPKTESSVRECIVGHPFAERLLELHQGRAPLCPARPNDALPDGYGVEAFTSPRTATRNYKAWCSRNDLDYIAPKNLRSTFATIHGEAGSIDSLVSLALGHSDGTTRGTYYQQSTLNGLRAIADNLGDYLLGLTPSDPKVTPSDPESAKNGVKTAVLGSLSGVA